MAEPTFRAPKGTRDILAPDSTRLRALVDEFALQAGHSGFGEVISPIFEDLGVFKRLGECTDVVTKEMFDFFDKGDPPQQLALRPELTASICRAYAEHRPTPPWKVWYEGPQFRYEQPQAGRYRQFTQVGVEVLGTDDPQADIDVIVLGARFFESLGLCQVELALNSLGSPGDLGSRQAYEQALSDYLNKNRSRLSAQTLVTLERNPLRVLDSKREQDSSVIAGAPVMVDFLDDESAAHFAAVRAGLDAVGIAYEISPRLVRASTTTPAPPSSLLPLDCRRAERGRWWWSLRRSRRRSRRPSHTRDRLCPRCRPGSCWPVTRRGFLRPLKARLKCLWSMSLEVQRR